MFAHDGKLTFRITIVPKVGAVLIWVGGCFDRGILGTGKELKIDFQVIFKYSFIFIKENYFLDFCKK